MIQNRHGLSVVLITGVLVLCTILGAPRRLFAQSDLGKISGFVKDPSGATVPNAKITIRNNSGVERQTATNESGYYVITNVPPDLYTLTAVAAGFQKYETKDNKLDPSADLVIEATLTVGSASQTVEVSASAVPLQTESATVQKLVTREQVDSLELMGRNPVLMANLIPGTRGGTLANLSFNFSQGPSNINGARTPESLITFDGAPAVRTRSNGTSIGAADLDSTQEIQILTADYAPEFGRSSGGQIRITSKSGSQDFHGAAYEYVRNTVFDQNPWQRNAVAATRGVTAPIHYNQFGYNIGGPLYIPNHFNTDKTKVFWYWGEEWVRYVFTDTSSLTVPTLLMRQGNFSELLDPANKFYGKAVQLVDPKTGLPFPGNIIPAPGTVTTGSTATANGLGILNAYPVPNLPTPLPNGNNWFFSAQHPQYQRKDTVAIDINLTDKQRLRFRRVYFTFWEYQPLDGNTNETPKYFDRPNQTNSIDHVWAISPTKVNEILLSFSLDNVHIPVDAAHFLNRAQGAAQGTGLFGLTYAYIFPVSEKLLPNRIPTINMASFSTINGGPYPSHSAGPIYDVSDSFTWITGNHTLKFGGLFERSGENDNDEINVQACPTCTNNQNGQFLFSNNGGKFVRPGYALATSNASVANAALGLFDSYSEIGHRAYTIFRSHMWEGFAQDSWKVRQRLTVNYGLRYTVIVPYHALWGNMIVFDPTLYDPSKAVAINPATGLITGTPTIDQLYNGMVIPGSGFPSSANGRVPEASSGLYKDLFHGLPNHYSDIQWGDIQPRLGFAYQLNNKTVFRAGGGRFITRLGVSDSIFLGGNPPFQPNASVAFGSVDNPGAGGAASIPLVVTTQSKAFKNPEAWAWNVTVERELFWKSLLSVGYVARRGVHLQREADINQPTTAIVAANPGVNINALRPYKGFSSIRETDNVANSIYNSLQVSWTRRFANDLQFGVSYTLSKSMDNGSNQRDVVPNTYNVSNLWGPSEFDARHILIFNYLYQLPLFRHQSGFTGKALGGWQISGITQFQTGLPCSVAGPNDYAGVGLDSNFGCGVNGQYWVVNGNPKIIGTFGPNGQWFATTNPDGSSIFTAPTAGTFNTQRVRNLIYQPGYQNWNLGLFKAFPINEKRGLQFRAEAYNVWGHPNWCSNSGCNGTTNIGLNPTNLATFGKVLTKGSGSSGQGERNLQLSLRFY
ncbi:MAG TPA: carboxypeptidase-like regulatory domain-containing protein, partial [Candidatus Acidoferrum sp.]|nr:carboxypeptidase-like regulatory domain-containing protein [Candidatus Acidoferrum sp.]